MKRSQPDGSARARIEQDGRDPADSSGRGNYDLLYPATTNDYGHAIRNSEHQVRGLVDQRRPLLRGPSCLVRSRQRRFRLPGPAQRPAAPVVGNLAEGGRKLAANLARLGAAAAARRSWPSRLCDLW